MTTTRTWADVPDAELVHWVAQADRPADQQAAFETIYLRYQHAVLALCGGLLWDDFDAASNAAQDAMVVAYSDLSGGRPPLEPAKLRAWLLGIARHRCQEEFRRRGRLDAFPDDRPDGDWETASRRRQAEVDRILEVVASSFTDRQRQVYELSTRQGVRGQALAATLQVPAAKADDYTYENVGLLAQGFGAFILAREGRPFCPILADILDGADWDGQVFTRVLRLRIVRHFDTCSTCGNCMTCQDSRKRLVRPYAPALLPILFGGLVHERVMRAIRTSSTTSTPQPPHQPPPPSLTRSPESGPEGRPEAGPDGRPESGRAGRLPRRLRMPAVVAAVVVIPFAAALFVTRETMSGGSSTTAPVARPVADTMPAIAYTTGTALMTRRGTQAPRTLATLPAGTTASELIWSSDRRWLGWLSGPVNAPANQVHVTSAATGSTSTWTCTGCETEAFMGDRLLTAGESTNSLTAHPAAGGNPATVTVPQVQGEAEAMDGLPELVGSTPQDASVIVAATGLPLSQLFRIDSTGTARSLGKLPENASPGGDRDPGAAGMIAYSPDRTLLAYGGNYLGSDPGEPSDSVTVINLRTMVPTTVDLPKDKTHPLRIQTVWIDSKDRVFASAWHQPGNGNIVPDTPVTPFVYQLQGGQLVETSASALSTSGGQNGWTATMTTGSTTVTPYKALPAGNLVAVNGRTQISLATGVTTYAWVPAPGVER